MCVCVCVCVSPFLLQKMHVAILVSELHFKNIFHLHDSELTRCKIFLNDRIRLPS